MSIPNEVVTEWLSQQTIPSNIRETELLARKAFKAGAEWSRKETATQCAAICVQFPEDAASQIMARIVETDD